MSGADGRAWYAGFGKCHNSPRAPLFLPPGFAVRQVSCGRQWPCFEKAAGQGSGAKVGKARHTLFGLPSQCRRARLRPPAVADRCSRFSGHIGVVGRDCRIFKGEGSPKLWKNVVESRQSLLTFPAGLHLQRKAVSQRSDGLSFATGQTAALEALGPRATRGARPVVMNSRDSLAALNEMTTVQVMHPYSVSGADGRAWYSGIEKCRPADGRKQA